MYVAQDAREHQSEKSRRGCQVAARLDFAQIPKNVFFHSDRTIRQGYKMFSFQKTFIVEHTRAGFKRQFCIADSAFQPANTCKMLHKDQM